MNNLKRYTLYFLNLVDIISCLLAFAPAYYVSFYLFPGRETAWEIIQVANYRVFPLIVLVAYVLVNIFSLYGDETFLKRSLAAELLASLKLSVYILAIVVLYFFFSKVSISYSRFFLGAYTLVQFVLNFLLRTLLKKRILPGLQKGNFSENLVIIGESDQLPAVIRNINESNDWRYHLSGVIYTDREGKWETLEELPVISNLDRLEADLGGADVDSVLVIPTNLSRQEIESLMKRLQNLGKTVQIQIEEYNQQGTYHKMDQIWSRAVMAY